MKSREVCASKNGKKGFQYIVFGWNYWHVVVNILICDVWEQGMGSWGRKTNTRVCRLLEVKERFSACRKEKFSATRVPLKESKITLSRFTVETVLWQYHDVMLCEISINLYECYLQTIKETWENMFTLRFASSVISISKRQAGINFGHKKAITKYWKQSKVFHSKWGNGKLARIE